MKSLTSLLDPRQEPDGVFAIISIGDKKEIESYFSDLYSEKIIKSIKLFKIEHDAVGWLLFTKSRLIFVLEQDCNYYNNRIKIIWQIDDLLSSKFNIKQIEKNEIQITDEKTILFETTLYSAERLITEIKKIIEATSETTKNSVQTTTLTKDTLISWVLDLAKTYEKVVKEKYLDKKSDLTLFENLPWGIDILMCQDYFKLIFLKPTKGQTNTKIKIDEYASPILVDYEADMALSNYKKTDDYLTDWTFSRRKFLSLPSIDEFVDMNIKSQLKSDSVSSLKKEKDTTLIFSGEGLQFINHVLDFLGWEDCKRELNCAIDSFKEGRATDCPNNLRMGFLTFLIYTCEFLEKGAIKTEKGKPVDVSQIQRILEKNGLDPMVRGFIGRTWSYASELAHIDRRGGKPPSDEENKLCLQLVLSLTEHLLNFLKKKLYLNKT